MGFMKSSATLVLANHRPESVDPARELMASHDAVILEEPPDDLFRQMLAGQMSIASYLQTLDLEYPEFSRRMAFALQELHAAGKTLYQVEPFVEILLEIHERLADGGSPADFPAGTQLHSVYTAERNATAALLDFYKVSVRGRFDEAVEAVKRFARADARRFLLRDRMRADAIVPLLNGPGAWYIEAGLIHYPLLQELKRRLAADYPLTVTFLMADAVRAMGFRGHLYGPGDLLTLLYRFHPGCSSGREDLLAARALVYNKLITKEEIADTAEPFPHTRDELKAGAIVRTLSLEDCRRLFPAVRRVPTDSARDMVRHYLDRKSESADRRVTPASTESEPMRR
jgi:hypothetical protein